MSLETQDEQEEAVKRFYTALSNIKLRRHLQSTMYDWFIEMLENDKIQL